MKAGVFFERDGILNIPQISNGRQKAPLTRDQFVVNRDAIPLLRRLKEAGFVLIATTNQPLVGQGLIPPNEMRYMHEVLRRELPLDDIMACPYDEPSHPCCKPQPGMFLEAAFKWVIDLNASFVISDKHADAKAAQIVGCTSIMVRSAWIGNDHHDFVVSDLAAAVDKVLELNRWKCREDCVIA